MTAYEAMMVALTSNLVLIGVITIVIAIVVQRRK
ncbi:hypothetical protein J2Z37_004843 [Ammoniphilus resinae]|uniref:Holin-like toxin n=1 Tax=Ammoniphilus resinae TaxID=861532 RepID=A0ABS4GX12_9BACL|nr:hypothetical protein [Ammoniphilus resinae]